MQSFYTLSMYLVLHVLGHKWDITTSSTRRPVHNNTLKNSDTVPMTIEEKPYMYWEEKPKCTMTAF